MNHLVQKRRDTKYVKCNVVYSYFDLPKPFWEVAGFRKVRLYWDISIETWISINKYTLYPRLTFCFLLFEREMGNYIQNFSDVLRYDNLITPNTQGVVTRSPKQVISPLLNNPVTFDMSKFLYDSEAF